MDEKNQGIIRSVLKNEITWVITFISITIGFFNMVVLPLQGMRIQLTQIQSDLSEGKDNYSKLVEANQKLTSRIDVLETKITQFVKNN